MFYNQISLVTLNRTQMQIVTTNLCGFYSSGTSVACSSNASALLLSLTSLIIHLVSAAKILRIDFFFKVHYTERHCILSGINHMDLS